MSAYIRLPSAYALSLMVAVIVVPAAIALAREWGLMDHPKGWKRHMQPTPYLGGASVLCGLSISVLVFVEGFPGLGWLLASSAGLCALGTFDDRHNLSASARILGTVVAAVVVWEAGLGWDVFASTTTDFLLTVLWVLAVVNAVNLLDLLDGAAAGTVAACAAACAALALVLADTAGAALAVAICGSCLGFLFYNLRSPSRIFLGDGGTMPLGLLIAVLIETLPWSKQGGFAAVSGGVLLCGLPLLDMTFRIFSRLRRGDTLLTAGPDSVANWLRARMPSARWVTLALAAVQATLGLIAVLATNAGGDALLVAGACTAILGGSLMVLLDASGFGRHLLTDRPPTGPGRRLGRQTAAISSPSNDPS